MCPIYRLAFPRCLFLRGYFLRQVVAGPFIRRRIRAKKQVRFSTRCDRVLKRVNCRLHYLSGTVLNELTERAQHLLKALTERYIREGHPVGSRTLARDAGMTLSPATIRNVIADLEDLGLVSSPHTSAGRIPTVQGYRLFVDTLLTVRPLEHSVVDSLKQTLGPEIQTAGLAETASALLSDVTQLAGVVTLPKREHAALQRVEFLPLSEEYCSALPCHQ